MRTFVIFVIIVFISICSVGMYRPGDVDENSLLCPRLSVIEIGKKEYAGIKAGTLDSLLFSLLEEHLPLHKDMLPKVGLFQQLPHSDNDTIGADYIYNVGDSDFVYRLFSIETGWEFIHGAKPDTTFGYRADLLTESCRGTYSSKRCDASVQFYRKREGEEEVLPYLREGFAFKVILSSGYIQSVEGVLFMCLLNHRRMWKAAFADSLGPSRISPPQFAPPAEPLPVPPLPKKKR